MDWVIEAGDGSISGVEVKLSASLSGDDFAGLRMLKEIAPKRFRRGVVLYSGNAVVPFGEDLIALPHSALWQS